MPEQITSRELFKSVATSLSLLTTDPRFGKSFDPSKLYKNWCDEFLVNNLSFIGTHNIISPRGKIVPVVYGKSFVSYPF